MTTSDSDPIESIAQDRSESDEDDREPTCFRCSDGSLSPDDVSSEIYFVNRSYKITENEGPLPQLSLPFRPGNANINLRFSPERVEELARDLEDAAECFRETFPWAVDSNEDQD